MGVPFRTSSGRDGLPGYSGEQGYVGKEGLMLAILLYRRRTGGTAVGTRALLAMAGASGAAMVGGLLLLLLGLG